MEGAVALYAEIGPRDGLESVMARVAVALGNGVMDCFGRAGRSGNFLSVRDINLRHAIKGVNALAELVKAFDNHRGRNQQKVTVGQVNVQSGAQAIVGNVGARERQDEPTRPGPLLVADADKESNDE